MMQMLIKVLWEDNEVINVDQSNFEVQIFQDLGHQSLNVIGTLTIPKLSQLNSKIPWCVMNADLA